MITTQLYGKHSGVLALRYVTMMLMWPGVIFRENFIEVKLMVLCCDLP